MESGIQSSFIPKDASAPTPLPRRREGGLSEVFILIAVVLLVASAALAGAVFLYQEYVGSSATSKVTQLQRAQAAFEPSLIQQITRLDDRMQSAEVILTHHIAPSSFFNALEQSTLSTVAFQSLDFQAGDAQHLSLKMVGIAQGVNSIALEGDLFSKNGVITNPIFSDISRQADGVHFTLTAILNPSAINYIQHMSQESAAAPAQDTQPAAPASLFSPQSATGTPAQ